MKTKFTKNRLIYGCIIFALALMTLLTLCIPLWSCPDVKLSESGFTLLDYKSDSLDMADEFVGILATWFLLQLIFSVVAMVFSVLSVFFFEDKTVNKLFLGFAVTCLIFSLLYMLLGIIANRVEYRYLYVGWDSNNNSFYFGMTTSIWSDKNLYFDVITLAYISFIIEVLIFALYILCRCLIKENADDVVLQKIKNDVANSDIVGIAKPREQPREQSFNDLGSSKAVVEVLKQYKELLDSGIITQEEFDMEKQKIFKP